MRSLPDGGDGSSVAFRKVSTEGFGVTFEEVQRYDWQSVTPPLDSRGRKYQRASNSFFPKATALREAGDELGERVFRFLAAVTSLAPNFGSKDIPFRPEWIDGTRRSAALEDFTDEDRAVLTQLTPVTNDPEIKARFADVAAALKFDHALVREAVYAYVATARVRETCDEWPRFISDLERAAQLAWKLGSKSQPYTDVMVYTEELVAKFSSADVGLCSARLMELMQEFGHGDAEKYATIAETLAQRTETKDAHFARSYWKLASDWHRRAKKDTDAKRCAIRAAETHVLEADAALQRKQPSYMASASNLATAVEALRRAEAPKERIEEVHRLLLERGKRTKDEMGSFSHEMNIGDLRERVVKRIEGCDFREAVRRLALDAFPLDPKKHRVDVEKLAQDHPISFLFSSSVVDREGRVKAHRPSLLTTDPVQREAALWAEMVHQATTIHWPFRVSAFIGPCRLQIWRDHHPRVRDLHFLVANHPFVPPGHEHSFARGFHAGFEGDWHAAAYFLVPQVENCIRYVLDNLGIITSKLDNKLIQEVRMLDKLMLMPETVEAFGEGHVFELRGILTEEFGSNLRNLLAHGLVTDGECYAPATEHLWWLLLRLCVIPILPRKKANASDDEKPNESEQGTV